ncbi:hypothetical protein PMAYCL1PPCAC_27431, partial [Pristionchus mayeri]
VQHFNLKGLNVTIDLIPSNIPFYGLSSLTTERFERFGSSINPELQVILNGFDDPIIDQVSNFLSAPIKKVEIGLYSTQLSPEDLTLCAQLLRGSIINELEVKMSSGLLEYADASSLDVEIANAPIELPDAPIGYSPEAFVEELESLALSSVHLIDESFSSSRFFGLSRSFWENFLNEVRRTG